MRRSLLVLLAMLGLAACSDSPQHDAAPEPGPHEGDCGAYVHELAGLPAGGDEKQQCLLDAFATGDHARLDVEAFTVEGDPLYYRYTVVGPQLVEVREDTTHDQFGTPAITTQRCTSLTVVDHYLTADGCA